MSCRTCGCTANMAHYVGCAELTTSPALRQRYAMAALTGLLSMGSNEERWTAVETLVRTAFVYADAMLAQETP
jgi:hypothetical protein